MSLDQIEIVQSQCFITSIFEVQLALEDELAAMNSDLLAKLRALRDRGNFGPPHANGGWRTPSDLHTRPEFAAFFEKIDRILGECATVESIPIEQRPILTHAWGTLMERHDFTRTHTHAWAAWTGVYYIQVDDLCGDLYFMDPRAGARMTMWPSTIVKDRSMVSYQPKPGMLLLFPSFLEHHSDPSRSDVERAFIAFNASLQGLSTLELSQQ